ncbi:MAG TPA: DUF488 domain-containing protein [Acidimicrobiia bacterium]|nr:DUF488 domain-containing protein [Acidimicrobiia bacterium]
MILTVGHGTAAADEFAELLRDAGVTTLVDIRRYPGSRRHPQFNQGEMEKWLPANGVEYRWSEALGGRRQGAPDSRNVGLRNEQFRAYADHMASDEFLHGVTELLRLVEKGRVVVMCSESVWWRCHRRLLADHLVLVEGTSVEHLMHDGRTSLHPVTAEARRDGNRVVYRGPEQLVLSPDS